MATHRVVCTEQEPVYWPATHAHITAVSTASYGTRADRRWTVPEVLAAMDYGDNFYTLGDQNGKVSRVSRVKCGTCQQELIRSEPDAGTDNNLDSLPFCNWR